MFTLMGNVIKKEAKEISVNADFEAFDKNKVRKIIPRKFRVQDGSLYEISQIRRSYTDKVGDAYHIHFVVRTKNERYFDILYDNKKLSWFLVVEIEDMLVFR